MDNTESKKNTMGTKNSDNKENAEITENTENTQNTQNAEDTEGQAEDARNKCRLCCCCRIALLGSAAEIIQVSDSCGSKLIIFNSFERCGAETMFEDLTTREEGERPRQDPGAHTAPSGQGRGSQCGRSDPRSGKHLFTTGAPPFPLGAASPPEPIALERHTQETA